jgi:peptidoglycan/LPS O-acetylase OafA/YrhL
LNSNLSTTKSSASQHLLFLDGLRGLAALYVMIGHARWLLWEGYSEGYVKHPEQYSMLNKTLMYFFSLFKFGHEAVLFFFVLSGFVIHLKYARNLSKLSPLKFGFSDYLYRRIKRIYPPFLIAILITFLFDTLGRKLQWKIYNGTTPYQLINENIGHNSWSLKTFVGNIFFLYKEYVPVYGTNGPAWSLKFEWWFYLLYPLFLLAGTKKIIYPTLVMILLFCASFFPQYWPERLLPEIFSMMLTWWLGVLLAEVYAKRIHVKFAYLSCASAFIFLTPFFDSSNVFYSVWVAIFFFGLISFFLSLSHKNKLIKLLERLKVTGDFSYSLYITHFPILVFVSGWLMQKNGNVLPIHFLYVFAGIIITIIFAYFIHFVSEIPFISGGKKKISTSKVELAGAQNTL